MKSGQYASAHNNNFDLLRLLAASQVVAMHAGEWLRLPGTPDILTLFPGVPVFFVISGFLITGSYIGRRQSLHDYARNRILRVYPGMTVNLALIFVLMVVTGAITLDALGDPRIYTYFAAIAATGWTKLGGVLAGSKSFTFGPETLPFFPGGALWTVGVEIGFYIVVPLIMGLPRKWLPAVFAASLGLAAVQMRLQSSWIDTTIPAYLWIFLLGAGARLAWDRVGWLFRQTFPIWLALHLLLWIVPDYKTPTLPAILSMLTLAGCSLSFAHTLPRISSILRRQDISYGVYLYHMPVILTLLWLGHSGEGWLWAAVFAATFVMAALSWLLVERPALALKRRGTAGDAAATLPSAIALSEPGAVESR